MQLKHTLSSDGRAWVNEVWETVDALCSKPLVSPTLIKLGARLSESYAAREKLEGKEIREALFAVITPGYASRAVLARSTEQPSLDSSSSLLLSATSNLKRDKAATAELIAALETLAGEDFQSVMTLPRELWAAYVSLAVMHLQERLVSSTLTWYELSAERIEAMLRHGYVLRCLDESLERERAVRKRG
jgi:hypothetical protein